MTHSLETLVQDFTFSNGRHVDHVDLIAEVHVTGESIGRFGPNDPDTIDALVEVEALEVADNQTFSEAELAEMRVVIEKECEEDPFAQMETLGLTG